MATETSPDYHGPTAPDSEGTPRAVPDVTHERFHEAVKDVLAGKIISPAREQMRDALGRAPEPPAPFPTRTLP